MGIHFVFLLFHKFIYISNLFLFSVNILFLTVLFYVFNASVGQGIPYPNGICNPSFPYAPYYTSCDLFLYCENGMYVAYECPYGLQWDSYNDSCVPAAISTCNEDTAYYYHWYYQTLPGRAEVKETINPTSVTTIIKIPTETRPSSKPTTTIPTAEIKKISTPTTTMPPTTSTSGEKSTANSVQNSQKQLSQISINSNVVEAKIIGGHNDRIIQGNIHDDNMINYISN